MSAKNKKTYTYRCGEKVELTKSPNEFVVRAAPEDLHDCCFSKAEQMSPSSYKLTTDSKELDGAMTAARATAVTHHAYYTADDSKEFLITDRIFVTFKEVPTPEQLDAFIGRYGLVKLENYSDKDFLFQLTGHTGMNPLKLVVELMEKDDTVESAENDLNHRLTTYQYQTPNDPS
ncbi:MAG: S8 family serine peptidase, partial [Gammaproteobacteria bacterium]